MNIGTLTLERPVPLEPIRIEYLLEKGSGAINEDKLLIGEGILGVFDGATSLVRYKDESGSTGGALASGLARDVFAKNDDTLANLALKANASIKDEMLRRGIDISEKLNLWSTTAAVLRVNANSFEWVQIGDSLILVIYEDRSFKLLVKDYDYDRETLKKWKRLAKKETPGIFHLLRPQIIKVRKKMNVSYGILNGEDAMSGFLKSGVESLTRVSHILIFTDGLFMPQRDPAQDRDFEELVKFYCRPGDLYTIRQYIRSREAADPDCWKYPRFKEHDDIAAIAITF